MFARTLTPVSLALALLVAAPLAGTDLAFAQAQPTAAAAKEVVHKVILTTGMAGGKMVYLDEKGAANPTLRVNVGDTVEITIGSGEGAEHDIVIPDLGVKSKAFNAQTGPTKVRFKATKAGKFSYYCSVPGHRQIGMEGLIDVSAGAAGGANAAASGAPAKSAAVKATAAASASPAAAPVAGLAPADVNAVSIAMDPQRRSGLGG